MLERNFCLNTTSEIFLAWCRQRKEQWYCAGMSWPTEKGEIRLLGGGGGPLAGNQKDRLEVLAMHVVPVDERAERGSLPLSIIEIQTTPLAPERCEVRATCHFEPARPLFMELLRAIGERWPESGLAQDWTARIQAIAAALRAGPSRYTSRPDSAWDALLRFPATVEDFEAWIERPLAELIPDYPPPYDLIGENTKGQKRFDLGKQEYATKKKGTERAGEDGEDDFIHIFRYKASLWRAGYSPYEETPLAEFQYELQGRELEVGVWCSKAREDADFIPWFAALLCQLEARWPEAKKGIDAMCVLRAPQIAAGEALPAEGEAGKAHATGGQPEPKHTMAEDITGWEREALRLWCEGLTATVIGERLGYTPKTVLNRLSELRRQYGPEVVPTDDMRKGRDMRDIKSG